MSYMRACMGSKFGQIRPLFNMSTDRVIMAKTVSTLFLGCFHPILFIRVDNNAMHENSMEFEIWPDPIPTAELAAFECLKNPHRLIMGKQCCHFFSAIVDQILFIFVSRFCLFCAFTRPRLQMSVYRTIGPLVIIYLHKLNNKYLLLPMSSLQ